MTKRIIFVLAILALVSTLPAIATEERGDNHNYDATIQLLTEELFLGRPACTGGWELQEIGGQICTVCQATGGIGACVNKPPAAQ